MIYTLLQALSLGGETGSKATMIHCPRPSLSFENESDTDIGDENGSHFRPRYVHGESSSDSDFNHGL